MSIFYLLCCVHWLSSPSTSAEVFDARDEWLQSMQSNPCTPDGKMWMFEYLGFWYENHKKCFRYILRTESQDEPCKVHDALTFDTDYHISLKLPFSSIPCKNDISNFMTQLFETPYPFMITTYLNVEDSLNLEFDSISYYDWQSQYESEGGQIYRLCLHNFDLGTTTFRGEASLISTSDHVDPSFPDLEVPDLCSVFDYTLTDTKGSSLTTSPHLESEGGSIWSESTIPMDEHHASSSVLDGEDGFRGIGERQNAFDFDEVEGVEWMDKDTVDIMDDDSSNQKQMERRNAMTPEDMDRFDEKGPYAPIKKVDALNEEEWEEILRQFWEKKEAEDAEAETMKRRAIGAKEWNQIEDDYQGGTNKDVHEDLHHIKYPGRRLLNDGSIESAS